MMTRSILKRTRKESAYLWLLAAACGLALAAPLIIFPLNSVRADAIMQQQRAAAAAPPVAPVKAPTPVLVEDKSTERRMPANLLRGVASWYGGVFNGRKTASGETYNMYAMTACHPTLPFGTKIKVTNRENHKSVVVRVTDRGLLYNGRMLDLSYAAAQKLDMVRPGVARVSIHVLKPTVTE